MNGKRWKRPVWTGIERRLRYPCGDTAAGEKQVSKSRRSRILNFKLLQSPSQRRSNQKRLIRRSLFQSLIIHRPPPHRRRTACVARCVIIRLLKTRRRKLPRACEGRCAQAGEGSQPIPRPHVPQRLGRIGQPLCRPMPLAVRSSRASHPPCSGVDPTRATAVSSAAVPGAAVAWASGRLCVSPIRKRPGRVPVDSACDLFPPAAPRCAAPRS